SCTCWIFFQLSRENFRPKTPDISWIPTPFVCQRKLLYHLKSFHTIKGYRTRITNAGQPNQTYINDVGIKRMISERRALLFQQSEEIIKALSVSHSSKG